MPWTIYCHTHVVTGRRYIGLTSRTWQRRWSQHVSQSTNFKSWSYFANAIRKYGKDAFSHEVLEVCETLEAANAAEERWIAHFDTTNMRMGFNVLLGGSQKPPSPERNPWDRPEYRAKQKKRLEAQWKDPVFRDSVVSSMKATKATSEYREGASARATALWEDPSYRAKVTVSSLPSPEDAARGVVAMKTAFATPESKSRRSLSSKKLWEVKREKLVSRQIELRKDSEYAARVHSGLVSGASRNRNKTHCLRGHEFTPENTHVDKRGSRNCRKCWKVRESLAFLSPVL